MCVCVCGVGKNLNFIIIILFYFSGEDRKIISNLVKGKKEYSINDVILKHGCHVTKYSSIIVESLIISLLLEIECPICKNIINKEKE
jgi:hypothetical protein